MTIPFSMELGVTGTTPRITQNLTIEGVAYNRVTSPQTQLTENGVPSAASYTWSVYGSNACGNHTCIKNVLQERDDNSHCCLSNEIVYPPSTSSSFYYTVPMTAGYHYIFATCNHDHGQGAAGGSATFDTHIQLFDASWSSLADQDDCGLGGLQSYLDYDCQTTGTYYIKLYGHNGAYGDYVLGFKYYIPCTAPTAPSLASPANADFLESSNNGSAVSVTYNWSASSGGTTPITYDLWWMVLQLLPEYGTSYVYSTPC